MKEKISVSVDYYTQAVDEATIIIGRCLDCEDERTLSAVKSVLESYSIVLWKLLVGGEKE